MKAKRKPVADLAKLKSAISRLKLALVLFLPPGERLPPIVWRDLETVTALALMEFRRRAGASRPRGRQDCSVPAWLDRNVGQDFRSEFRKMSEEKRRSVQKVLTEHLLAQSWSGDSNAKTERI